MTSTIKTIKRTITELDRSKIEEQKKAVRAGYDMDIIPSDLATYGKDAKALLKELQSQNERNPDGKDIRFIDSHYRDLFRIPDGGTIQVHYSDDSVVIKPCKFIDE